MQSALKLYSLVHYLDLKALSLSLGVDSWPEKLRVARIVGIDVIVRFSKDNTCS